MSIVQIESQGGYWRVKGGVFNSLCEHVGDVLLTSDEVKSFRDEALKLFPLGYTPQPSADINEETLEVLLDISDEYDRGKAVKAYLSERGLLK